MGAVLLRARCPSCCQTNSIKALIQSHKDTNWHHKLLKLLSSARQVIKHQQAVFFWDINYDIISFTLPTPPAISTATLTMLRYQCNIMVPCKTILSTTRNEINTYSSCSTYIWRILATMHIGVNVSIENMPRTNATNKQHNMCQSILVFSNMSTKLTVIVLVSYCMR